MMQEEGRHIPSDWNDLPLERMKGTILVIGASDRGKTTLVRWLMRRLTSRGSQVGWLDGDIGQSTLGLPTTMTLALGEHPAEQLPEPSAAFFVGATSPKGCMLPHVTGFRLLRDLALRSGSDTVVVDTTGLVAENAGGGALQEWTIELLNPQFVIALQYGRELKHLLPALRRDRRRHLHVLKPAPAVRTRSTQERAHNRRERFRRYFQAAHPLLLRLGTVPVYGLRRAGPGQLAALLDPAGFCQALALLHQRTSDGLILQTPWAGLKGVSAVRFGIMSLDPATGAAMRTNRH
ncbi:MAG: Clp1/GlmU family protein [Desulfobacteraceae bacterium]|jgi:polynucleotide 5'-hydroxyl-kinase GRC3/NOL9